MSPQEMLWRASDVARKAAWKPCQEPFGKIPPVSSRPRLSPDRKSLRYRRPGRVIFSARLPQDALADLPEEETRALIASANELLEGRWNILGLARRDLVDPDWFLDPMTGRRAPQETYCFNINHRDENITGNVKQIWELSRHHHLTVLASAYALTRDRRYAERVASHLRSWWEQNPFLSGIHWTSGIEIGIRLIAWVWIRRLLDSWDGVCDLFENSDLALRQIWWHQRYLAGFRSRGSSANNHVIAEAAGQLVASLAFDWFEQSPRWADEAAQLLETEMARNTFPSGVNRELAYDYHGLVAELGLIAGAEADLAGHPLTRSTWRTLGQMLDVTAACLDITLMPPRQGDSDDGRALVVAAPDRNRWEALLALGAAIFEPLIWWPSARTGIASRLLSSVTAQHRFSDRPVERPWHFADAGLTILRTDPQDGPEIWCRCDGGPHGFLSIAAHAHADALSVELRHAGTNILADPGTYCYGSEPPFRQYFRSTIGHNTVEIGDRDQSIAGGPTMWMRHARTQVLAAEVTSSDGMTEWTAQHDGYQDHQPAVTHRRNVRLWSAGRRVEIADTIETAGSVDIRIAFHLGPDVKAELHGTQLSLTWKDDAGELFQAAMSLPANLGWTLFHGSDYPVLGWYSPGFGRKVPATDIIGVGVLGGPTTLHTQLDFSPTR